jgi:hypothetical protein
MSVTRVEIPACITAQVNFEYESYTVEVELKMILTGRNQIDVSAVHWDDDHAPHAEYRTKEGLTYTDAAGDAAVELLKGAIG